MLPLSEVRKEKREKWKVTSAAPAALLTKIGFRLSAFGFVSSVQCPVSSLHPVFTYRLASYFMINVHPLLLGSRPKRIIKDYTVHTVLMYCRYGKVNLVRLRYDDINPLATDASTSPT